MPSGGSITRLVIIVIAFLVSAGVARATGPGGACDPLSTDVPDIQTVAHWVLGLQYTNSALPSYGAVKIHHTPGLVAPNGDAYFHVVPYQTNLGLRGLLHAPVEGKVQAAETWIGWYLRHLKMSGAPPGVVYDHWYRADGTGETTAPPGLSPALANFDDASDSCAATFLGLVRTYYEEGGNRAAAFLRAPGLKQKLETVATVMLALQQPDSLCWAKSSYRVKYLMDNSEVYWGLSSLALLEADLYGDSTASRTYRQAATRVQNAILSSLYNARTGLYRVARFSSRSVTDANLNEWYPGTVALAWPHLFGVTDAHSPLTQAQMAALDQSWGGGVHPDWSTHVVDPSGFPWASAAYASLLAGDCARARAHTEMVKQLKLPASPQDTGCTWPFAVDDAGWLLLTLTQLSQQ